MNLSADELTRILQQPGYTVAEPLTQLVPGAPQTPPGRTEARSKGQRTNVAMTPLQTAFETLYRQLGGVGEWRYNYRFLPGRRYELDYALPAIKTGVEVNGGQWMKSGHSSGRGLHRDADKQNLAILHGWVVFWLTTDMLSPNANPEHVARIVRYVRGRLHDAREERIGDAE